MFQPLPVHIRIRRVTRVFEGRDGFQNSPCGGIAWWKTPHYTRKDEAAILV